MITDIQVLQAVIGLVETHGKWGVIDRMSENTVLTLGEDGVDEQSDDDMENI